MKLKTFTAIILIFFTLFMTGLFTMGIVSYAKHKETAASTQKTQDQNNKLADAGSLNDPSVLGALTKEVVAQHNTISDCWLIIEDNVYDVSSFVFQHPGGSGLITQYCGQDATNPFNTRDRNPAEKHSTFAKNLLRSYYVGPLGRVPNNLLFPNPDNPGNPIVINPAQSGRGSKVPINLLIPSSGSAGQNTNLTIDSKEVSYHNTLQNCWLIISGKVYDVTSFVSQHPGGQSAITPYCGKEATTAFQTKGGGGSHSSYAYSLLGNYLIADLGATVTVNTTAGSGVATTGNTNNNIATPTTNVFISTPTSVPTQQTNSTPQNQNLVLTTSEVSSHNTLQNCWLIISNNVYDVTKFISQHPGGQTAITSWCGKESTTAFQTRGGSGGNHSSYAYSLLSKYLIGSIGSSVPVNPTSAPTQSGGGGGATATPVPSSGGGGGGGSIPSAILSAYPDATKKSGGYEDNGSWEGEVNTSSGCRHIKTNSSGSITSNEKC